MLSHYSWICMFISASLIWSKCYMHDFIFCREVRKTSEFLWNLQQNLYVLYNMYVFWARPTTKSNNVIELLDNSILNWSLNKLNYVSRTFKWQKRILVKYKVSAIYWHCLRLKGLRLLRFFLYWNMKEKNCRRENIINLFELCIGYFSNISRS